MSLVVLCHACQRAHSFSDVVPFRASCDACAADLHACLGCRFHDRYVENECREDQADPISKKDRSNLCEYFKPKATDASGDVDEVARAKERLAALFGGPPTSASHAASPPAAASGGAATSGASGPLSAADEARRKLDALFKK